ncbi:MAG: hypothetical protein ACE5GE_10895 [Phycisphaerae bacterium]
MNKGDLWQDKRSGKAGTIAGNLVLNELAKRYGQQIERRKGTSFLSEDHLFVGRTCGSPDYLAKDEVHFANLSPRQYNEVVKEARQQRRKLLFVFITAFPGEVHYWCIPASVMAKIRPRLKLKPSDKCWHLRIRPQGGRFFLEGEDVSEYHAILELPENAIAELSGLLSKTQEREGRPMDLTRLAGLAIGEQLSDVRLQRVLQHGDELAVLLPRSLAEAVALSAGSLVQATTSAGAILLRPVEVVPRLSAEDQRFADKLFRRRRRVFEALGE